ncbi:protein of unknown function [Nitrosomonas nitrosa]|uniref:DUF4156 domain-containing protein n=1 Tax=Nitrosomonas nitrosa TaxID=52442 RepID=A0A1I4SQP5_9PROT|nr:DUF4156 domain-containing protein [Nitrosomonas nitrosa]SFM66725.1 protein of unknown function [Nitrosomonas nitrosa]
MRIMVKFKLWVSQRFQHGLYKSAVRRVPDVGRFRLAAGSMRASCTVKALLERSICLVALCCFVSTGHASTPAPAPAPNDPTTVMILLGEQDLTSCKLLGNVTGSSLDSENEASYPVRLMSARNKLRNEAASLGGNTVHVRQIDARNAGRFEIPGTDKKITFTGQAYFCE